MLLVKELILPLPCRISRLRIRRSIDERNQILHSEAFRKIRHAKIRDAKAASRMMARDAPDHRTAPIVTDPHGAIASERLQKLEHVVDRMFERVMFMPVIDRGSPVASHVRSDRPESQRTEARQRMTPAERELRPAVHEDHERPVLGPAGEVESRVPRSLERVFCN